MTVGSGIAPDLLTQVPCEQGTKRSRAYL